MLNPFTFVLTLKSKARPSQVSSLGLAQEKDPGFEELLNYSLTLGGQGRSLGESNQIHIPGKRINRGSGAWAGSVAPSFSFPLSGEPDGTPQGRRGTCGASGEDLRER